MSFLVFRWLLAGTLLLWFALCAIANIMGPIQVSKTRPGKGYSMIPFGGVAGTLGLLLAPSADLQRWWWVPLVLDLGTGLLLMSLAVAVVTWAFRRLFPRSNASKHKEE